MKPFKIWCETEAEQKKVLKKLEKMGCRWARSKDKPTERGYVPPIGYFVDECNSLTYVHQSQRNYFRNHRYEMIPINEFLKDGTIVIYRNGQEVIALDKSTGERGVAKCNPADKFDFKVGAKLAFERLMGDEFIPFEPAQAENSTFYALCVKSVKSWSISPSKGKIYKFTNGVTKWENGCDSMRYKSFEDFVKKNLSANNCFIELKDGVKFQIKPDVAKYNCSAYAIEHAGEIIEMTGVTDHGNIEAGLWYLKPEWLNPIKEVERKAKKGEFVKIVNKRGQSRNYENGDILKIVDDKSWSRYSKKIGEFLYKYEYVVLEGYEDCKHVKKFEPEYYNGKICITKVQGGNLTVGKIYEVKEGLFVANDGLKYPIYRTPIKSVEDLKTYFKDRNNVIVEFVEVVE